MKRKIASLIIVCLPFLTFAQNLVLDKNFKNNTGTKEVAIVIINSVNKIILQTLTQDVSDIFKNNKGYNSNPSFFNTNFIKDGSFEKLFKGEEYKIKKLHLKDNLDFICLGKYQVNSIAKSEFDLYVADVTMQLNVLDIKSGAITDSRSYTARGTGVTKNDAELNSQKKLTDQLK